MNSIYYWSSFKCKEAGLSLTFSTVQFGFDPQIYQAGFLISTGKSLKNLI